MYTMDKEFLDRIHLEYQNRLQNGIDKETAKVFEYQFFIEKYKYSKKTIEILVENLSKKGALDKWILEAFEYLGD